MPYTFEQTPLAGVLILKPKVFFDARGFFYESFNAREFEKLTGLKRSFVQDNHSRSAKGVLRGLHYQLQQTQGKLVRVVLGEVFDVAVDMRRSSPTFGKWTGARLSSDNQLQIWIPEGFAHGFYVLSETAELLYKTTNYYNPQSEQTILWNDPDISVDWGLVGEPVLAEKDRNACHLTEAEPFA